MTFLDDVRVRARERPRTLVFPEGTDERTLQATVHLAREDLVHPILLGPPGKAEALAAAGGADLHIEGVEPESDPRLEPLAHRLWERRRARGLTQEDALSHA
ncbi:MAG TPA: phosphate acyltransferase, partial [Longimicrobiaceae bacterium]|nr:phosphate acyltransferase [Longimicrobiaceae bacterium]